MIIKYIYSSAVAYRHVIKKNRIQARNIRQQQNRTEKAAKAAAAEPQSERAPDAAAYTKEQWFDSYKKANRRPDHYWRDSTKPTPANFYGSLSQTEPITWIPKKFLHGAYDLEKIWHPIKYLHGCYDRDGHWIGSHYDGRVFTPDGQLVDLADYEKFAGATV